MICAMKDHIRGFLQDLKVRLPVQMKIRESGTKGQSFLQLHLPDWIRRIRLQLLPEEVLPVQGVILQIIDLFIAVLLIEGDCTVIALDDLKKKLSALILPGTFCMQIQQAGAYPLAPIFRNDTEGSAPKGPDPVEFLDAPRIRPTGLSSSKAT